jgi:hypothetical protein
MALNKTKDCLELKKYKIDNYINKKMRDLIMQELSISRSSFYLKSSKKIGEKGGFEICEMLVISSILGRDLNDLITNEALEYYSK